MRTSPVLRVGLLLMFIVGLARANAFAADSNAPRMLSCDPDALVRNKARLVSGDPEISSAVAALVAEADKALKQGSYSVVDKPTTPASGDKHDYMSLSPYWWPDPAKPDGLPYVRKDGEVNPEREKFDQPRIEEFTKNAFTLGLAYYFTGDEKYAEHAAKLLRVWFLDDATKMNPSFHYAQVVRGREEKDRASGLIECGRLVRSAEAAGLIAGSKAWTSEDQARMVDWYKRFVDFMINGEMGKKERRAVNNHGTWYAVTLAQLALFAGEDDVARQIIEEQGKSRIASQIEPDGRQPHELARTKAFDYSRYNLVALMNLAALADRFGIDLWNYQTEDGRSIRVALDWLAPYAVGDKTWEHQQIVEARTYEMFTVLRRAAIAYREPKYEQMAQKVPGAEQVRNRIELLYPRPKF